MATKKASTKGKRYTAEEKQAVVDFVNNHNATNGRGGVTAAVKKFGASQLSIAAWVKAGPASSKSAKSGRAASVVTGRRSSVLAELAKLDGVIAGKRKELDGLEARFQKLKASL
jgi:transposase-like protein